MYLKLKYFIQNNNENYLKIKLYFIILLNIILFCLIFFRKKIKKVGIVGVRHEANIGNNLIKYAMSIKISEIGYIPYIIGTLWKKYNNIDFIKQQTNLVIINESFNEIKKNDYDMLIVNSDQTWVKFDQNFYDYGFLKFAEKWNIPKMVYGASLGYDKWKFSEEDEKIAKHLLSDFSGISVREKGSIELIEKHLGIKPKFVLDPTFLIDKSYYLNLIKDFKDKHSIKNHNYIFTYNIANTSYVIQSMKEASQELNMETYYFPLNNHSSVINFLFYIVNSKAVITNSYHGTVFSIIFNKPFLTFFPKNSAKERYNSLGSIFHISERMIELGQEPNFNLLKIPLNINQEILNQLKKESIKFLKDHLK